MPIAVVYPKVSLELASGRISRWLVTEGASVQAGQILFEIENDKAAVEVDSPASGVIHHLAAPDTEVEVGATVARIFANGEAVTDKAAPAAPAPGPVKTAPNPVPPPARAGLNPTPLARRIAQAEGLSLTGITGSGPRGRVQKKDVLALISNRPTSATNALLHGVWLRRGQGLPMVLLHGFSGELNSWRGMLAAARNDTPAFALDLPAHGNSPRDLPQDLDAMAEAVEATLAAQNIGPMLLVGHSFGAALAARIAARAVCDVNAMCLFAPAGLGPEINHAFTTGVLRAESESSLRPWLTLLVEDPEAMTTAFVRAVVEQRKDQALTRAMQAFAARFFPDGTQSLSILADLATLPHPVRVVFGLQDRILPVAATARLPANVALHRIDRCGHMPQIEHRALCLRILDELRRSA
jgi:pimeloyl-ACP methyl ester carboxylesterase